LTKNTTYLQKATNTILFNVPAWQFDLFFILLLIHKSGGIKMLKRKIIISVLYNETGRQS